jgi:hypothetical protein
MYLAQLKIIGITFLVISVSGCQYVPEKWGIDESLSFFTNESETISEPLVHTDFSPKINEFLSVAKNGSSQLFEASPWGPEALITLDRLYFSASGRTCRSITISQEEKTNYEVVCQSAAQHWVAIRPVTKVNQLK